MNRRRSRRRLDARVWPEILETLVPATDRRLDEIMAWADRHDQQWLFDFLEARAASLKAGEGRDIVPRILPEDMLAEKFGLTLAQARVLSAFLAGKSLKEIAALQSVSITTVRTHFVQMRAKLGARDQADVVRVGPAQVAWQEALKPPEQQIPAQREEQRGEGAALPDARSDAEPLVVVARCCNPAPVAEVQVVHESTEVPRELQVGQHVSQEVVRQRRKGGQEVKEDRGGPFGYEAGRAHFSVQLQHVVQHGAARQDTSLGRRDSLGEQRFDTQADRICHQPNVGVDDGERPHFLRLVVPNSLEFTVELLGDKHHRGLVEGGVAGIVHGEGRQKRLPTMLRGELPKGFVQNVHRQGAKHPPCRVRNAIRAWGRRAGQCNGLLQVRATDSPSLLVNEEGAHGRMQALLVDRIGPEPSQSAVAVEPTSREGVAPVSAKCLRHARAVRAQLPLRVHDGRQRGRPPRGHPLELQQDLGSPPNPRVFVQEREVVVEALQRGLNFFTGQGDSMIAKASKAQVRRMQQQARSE